MFVVASETYFLDQGINIVRAETGVTIFYTFKIFFATVPVPLWV